MKAFERWEGTHSPGEYAYQKWEESWRAALEWVQSSLKFGSEVAYSEADILIAIKKEIREELGE